MYLAFAHHPLSPASAGFGREVAFLGADNEDSAGDARAFLAQHPVSYPSYQTSTAALGSLAAMVGLPTTIFIERVGNVVHAHVGQYASLGTPDEDLDTYVLGGRALARRPAQRRPAGGLLRIVSAGKRARADPRRVPGYGPVRTPAHGDHRPSNPCHPPPGRVARPADMCHRPELHSDRIERNHQLRARGGDGP